MEYSIEVLSKELEKVKADMKKPNYISLTGYKKEKTLIADLKLAISILNGEIRERELIDFATEMQKIGFNEMDSVEQTVSIYLKSIKERT